MSDSGFSHITVLKDELVKGLALKPGALAVDCTAGGGGHTRLMLEQVGPSGHIYAIDRDQLAITTLTQRFEQELERGEISLLKGSFSEVISEIPDQVDAIAADLGVSSPQLDLAERGFSFMKDGPLDMRMNPEQGPSAADIIRDYDQHELTTLFRKWGEEPKAKFIAQAIVKQRDITPITTTLQLAEIVKGAVHYKTKSHKHPATKVFQALRIAVNEELTEVESLLSKALTKLKPGGRLAIITFHSLEDRIVKQFFKQCSGSANQIPELRGLPLTEEQLSQYYKAEGKIIKPFPVNPTDEEIDRNPRSRSARLRVLEKC